MRPIELIDAWPEPAGEVVVTRSRLFPRQVTVLLSVRQGESRVQRRTCIRLGEDIEVADRGVIAARLRQLWYRRRRHDTAG